MPDEENEIYQINVILLEPAASLYITFYNGYPFSLWQTGNQFILIEGMIYNQSINKIEAQLKAISQCFSDNGDCHQLVKAFVESADGEFLVEIWDNDKKRLLLFNDYWGRLPIYYYRLNERCGIGREIKNLLAFIPSIMFNKTSLVEFLYYEFTFGNKTLFKDIYRLRPAGMMIVEVKEKDIELKVTQTVDYDFDVNEQFSSHSKSIGVLRELFLESVQSRVKTLKNDGFRLVADLSGGFDSRVILGGLEKFTHEVIYCSQKLIANDERKWGKAIFEAMGSPGKFYIAEPDHSYEIDNLGDFIYQYDCLANFRIGFNSRQVAKTFRELAPEKAARFMGFGGEFLRHSIKAFRKSLVYGIDHGFYFYSNISLSEVCHMVGLSYDDYHKELEEYLKTCPEQTSEGQLRRLYFEHYQVYVNAGEDYSRKYFWTVCPFWGTTFMRAVLERTPLDWTDFRYFTHFMKAVDPRLLKAPIFGKSVQLDSERSVAMLETKERIKTWIKVFIPTVHSFSKKIQARLKDGDLWNEIEPLIRDITCPLIQSTFSEGQLKLNASNVLIARRYLTLLLYLREVEKRYSEKISV